MAYLEDKVDQIPDPELRREIKNEIKKLKNRKQFGLVFEQHIPEVVPVYRTPVRKDSIVSKKMGNLIETYRVKKIIGENVELVKDLDGSIEIVPTESVVVVKQFGESIYPALVREDTIKNGGGETHHILIEADNYHALQLLEYMYPKKIDCIYLDPPYNTGAQDWKYNNNYVDRNDSYRHSKWLSMMQKRLIIAKNLLKADGVIIITIDDYELYHLGTLLEELFPEYDQFIVSIEHNRRGRRGKNFAKTNEFALYLVPTGQDIIQEEFLGEVIGGENRNLRRTGSGSLRHQRWRKFYPIYVNKETLEIVKIGDPIPLDQKRFDECNGNIVPVWPVDEDNIEKNWHYGAERTKSELAKGKVEARRQSYGIQIYYTLREKQSKKYKTVWSKPTLDASTYGTELLANILNTPSAFDFPKSVYAVLECLTAVCRNRENALILDFFAGSGTTLHSVLMLNELLGSNHQCIMITNNEVSSHDAALLEQEGLYPGHVDWENKGICRSVTYPRCKYTILGYRDDGSAIDGDYATGRLITKEKARSFYHVGFVDGKSLNTTLRKQLVSLIDKIPQAKIHENLPFYLDEENVASILFDVEKIDDYLEELEDYSHVSEFYIVTTDKKKFNSIKKSITEILGPIEIKIEEKASFSSGFKANFDYFKLDFLEPNEVATGMQFKAILPILWAMAGGKGDLPDYREGEPYFIPEDSTFAVLLKETKFRDFVSRIKGNKDITHVFLVTNSEDAFFEMKNEIEAQNVIMLYKSYLKNFEINKLRKE